MTRWIRRSRAGRTEEMVAEAGELRRGDRAPALAAALAGAPLFAGFSPRGLDGILAEFDETRFRRGHRIVLEGLRGSDFFVIAAGTAAVVSADGRQLATLGQGDFFGEMAVLDEGLRSASVVALSPLHCALLANGRLLPLLREHPQLSLNLLRAMSHRLRGTLGRRAPVSVRLARA